MSWSGLVECAASMCSASWMSSSFFLWQRFWDWVNMVQSMQFHTDPQNLDKYFYQVGVRFDILTKKKRSFKYFFFLLFQVIILVLPWFWMLIFLMMINTNCLLSTIKISRNLSNQLNCCSYMWEYFGRRDFWVAKICFLILQLRAVLVNSWGRAAGCHSFSNIWGPPS